MSNTNNNLQTQTSNALHNVIMETSGKDRPLMLAPGNYVQWKSRFKRYINTKPNNELIHYCLQNPLYKFKWTDKTVLVAKGSSETTTEGYMEKYKNVSQDIRNQLDAEAEAVQIILTVINNDVYSTVDACPNACEMCKAIKRLKQGESINVQDLETNLYWEFGKFTSRDGESLKYSQQAATKNRGKAIINSPPPTYDQEPTMVAEDDDLSKEKEIDKLMALISLSFKKIYKPTNNNLRTSLNTSTQVVQQFGIQCYNCKEYGHVARECQKPKRAKDAAYHKEKMILCKQEEIQEVTPDVTDNSGPIFDTEPLQKVQNDYDNYNVFANDREHPEQPDSVNDTYPDEQERDLLASLIDKLKCEINDNKNHNKLLESSNKTLVDKLKEMKKELFAHQETISIMSQDKEAQNKFYKTCEDKEIEKVIALENKVKVLDDIVYKTAQSVQTINMPNRNCKTSFVKPEFLKKAQRANPRLYDIGCYNDNRALMLAPESDETIHLAHESRSKLTMSRTDKNEKAFKENQSKVFLKEHEQYFEIQDLKAQLQDKGIAISNLKKHIEKLKGKFVETKFEKPSVIRQPNAFKSQRQSVLGKPATFSDSLAKTDFSKSNSVTTNNVSNDFSNLVTAQILPQNVKSILKNTNVIAPRLYKVHTKTNQTRTPQLSQYIRKTNKRVSFSTRVISTTSVSKPQLKSNRLEDRVMHNNSEGKKQQVEDHRRNFKFSNNKMSVTACNDNLNVKTSNVNFVCVTCGKCVLNDNHDMCVLHYINGVNSRTKMPMVVPISTREPKRTVNQSIVTPLKRTVASESTNQKPRSKLKKQYEQISKTCTVKFGNDQIAPILGYGDLVQGNVTIKRGNDLLAGSHGTYLYSITLQDTSTPNPICLMAKATSSQAWLWHRRLSHLNFDTINLLSKYGIVTGLPKLKFVKDHLCSSCELGKAKWYSTQSRAYRVYNNRTRVIVETIHVNFDELPQMASNHVSSDPVLQCLTTTLKKFSLSPGPQSQENVPQPAEIVTTSNELDLLFSAMFDELLNGTTQVVSKSSVVNATDAPEKRQQQNTTSPTSTTVAADIPQLNIQTTPETTSQAPTQAPTQALTITINENIIQAETNKEHEVDEDEFINIFSTPNKTSARKDGEMCMFALTVSRTESKNVKEAMADSAWIEAMQEEFHQFDRLEIHQSPRGIFINQAKYAQEILKKHGMTLCDRVGTPMATKPLDVDLSGTSVDQTKYHSDHAGCLDTRKSTSGGIQFLGGDKLVSWSSKKQECTSMSSAEAEYVSLSACCTQFLWLITQLTDYGFHFDKIPMYCDSKTTIAISRNPVQHSRTKHIDVRYHFIKE
ncbi:retrovirus-related pol polyprotein from transposon TNT 1-94 [Tanacetum coccineum]|uniref:Retrovirus-related pol polyprotein from transposon TNT 1-94 n=1 Tax=Tanacetum coccineum TaxID=301880 RepID=A0ABQ4XMI4_9ASTR